MSRAADFLMHPDSTLGIRYLAQLLDIAGALLVPHTSFWQLAHKEADLRTKLNKADRRTKHRGWQTLCTLTLPTNTFCLCSHTDDIQVSFFIDWGTICPPNDMSRFLLTSSIVYPEA